MMFDRRMPFPLAGAGALAVVCLLGCFQSPSALAQKNDYVYLKNGDRLTVEVKELTRGQMRLSTDAFGTIHVNGKMWSASKRTSGYKSSCWTGVASSVGGRFQRSRV